MVSLCSSEKSVSGLAARVPLAMVATLWRGWWFVPFTYIILSIWHHVLRAVGALRWLSTA